MNDNRGNKGAILLFVFLLVFLIPAPTIFIGTETSFEVNLLVSVSFQNAFDLCLKIWLGLESKFIVTAPYF